MIRVCYVLPDPDPALTLRLGPADRPSMPHRGDVILFGVCECPARVEERVLLDAQGVWEIHLTPLDGTPRERWREAGFRSTEPPDDREPPF